MSQRSNLLSAILVSLSLIMLLAVFWRGSQSSQASQENPLDFTCEVSCSSTELRTPIAELSWQAQAAQVDLTQQVLEVTIFKDGFRRDIQARLTPIQGTQKFSLSALAAAQLSQSSLARLEVAGLQVHGDGRVQLRVKGLEPGLNYFWRLQSADGATVLSGPVRSMAPSCPADEAKEAEEK